LQRSIQGDNVDYEEIMKKMEERRKNC